ncbi:glycosyl transferase [Embleya scabrispora]|uniref:D-inositol 3-phosphate glycosyltransferase n=2 Tax=Embleya scabrispora TaxID=159449 RepID=A0A1T3P8C6_9ACTN|nr:glycosyl transferase [Embleya scabrispora]
MGQYPPAHNAGGEIATHAMLRALVARGHDVSVWLARYGSAARPYEVDGVRVVPFETQADFDTALRRSHAVLGQYELVPATRALANGYGKPLIVPVHTSRPPTLRNLVAGTTALAVHNSQWVSREAEALLAEQPDATRPNASIVVRPPVVAAEYATTPGDRVTLVNPCHEKGGTVVRELARRMPDTAFMVVAGAYGEQVDYTGLNNVSVVGHTAGAAAMRDRVYARSRIVLMPSTYESWGRVAVEAMASGIPVIASPTPGLRECLGDAGTFADPRDIDAWETALRRLEKPAAWKAASSRALARSAELDPTDDLEAFVSAVEALH